MKTKLFFLIVILCYLVSFGQPRDFVITDNAISIYSVYSSDIDGDGDIDVLSASTDDNKVAWHENDGIGNFSEHIISTVTTDPNDIYSIDLDGDGDMDVLVAYWTANNTVAWFENTDGQGNFEMHVVPGPPTGISVRAADLDGDGDMDIISAYKPVDTVVWHENDGSANFSVMHTITTTADGVRTIHPGDFDNDGDWDVVSCGQDDGKISWYENDGSGNFTSHPAIITAPNGAYRVSAGDMDGDGDDDVIAQVNDAEIYWCEYLGAGNWDIHEITSNSLYPEWLYPVDLDKDGEMDVITANQGDHETVWYKNLGNGDFEKWIISTINEVGENPRTVHANDINNDGYIEIISGWWSENSVVWTMNPLGVGDVSLEEIHVYPSPTSGMLHIDSDTPISKIDIYDGNGKLVVSQKDQNSIDLTNLSSGVYLMELTDLSSNTLTKKIIKK